MFVLDYFGRLIAGGHFNICILGQDAFDGIYMVQAMPPVTLPVTSVLTARLSSATLSLFVSALCFEQRVPC